jgi:flagellar biogenesis protein FliO
VVTPLLLLLQQAAYAPPASGGYLLELLRMLFALALVCGAAFFALRWLARRGAIGGAVPGLDPKLQVRVLSRVMLEPRKALYVVQVGERRLLLGSGDGGAPTLLLELAPDSDPQERVGANGERSAEARR